ncbi:VWA domain-containing protein [Xanthobacter sp. V4C-4]|uniref:VWA domain-containing protein n=1 Tax=Xanthobacter cornucopiae TaxID=3119924 RepID=UPI003728A874
MIPADFHFLRPAWLLALVPALLIALAGWRSLRAGREDWRGLVDAHLLRHLAVRGEAGAGRWPVALLLAGWVLASLAMAGPTWRKLPAPALDRLDPTVMVLSLGRTMDATDQAPSRLTAARHKLDDVVARMRGGQVGLIVFADVPFVAAPLTEDGRIIAQMLPELATDLMPVDASRPDLAIAKAVELLKGANAREGRIVLVTDGVGDDPARTRAAAAAAATAGYRVSVIGVGSVMGGTRAAPDGGLLRGADGAPALARMDKARLTQVAEQGGGTFVPLSVDDRDLDAIFAAPLAAGGGNPLQDSGMTADQWADMGPYLALVLLLLAPLAFRRGLLFALPLALLVLPPGGARAQDGAAPPAPAAMDTRWSDLWRRPDQQGADAYAGGDYAGAARRFENPEWQASALYKAGRFEEAAAAFGRVPGGDYNRGNALARAGQLEQALSAYDAALKADPAHADALFNRDLVQQLLKRQKDEEQKKQSGGGGQQQNDPKTGDKGQSGADKGGEKKTPSKPDAAQSGDAKGRDSKGGDAQSGDPKSGDPKPPAPANPPKPNEAKANEAKPTEAKPDPKSQAKPESKPEPKPDPGPPPGAPPPRPDPAAARPAPSPPAAPEPGRTAAPPPGEGAQDQGPPPRPVAASPSGQKDDTGEPGAVALPSSGAPLSEQDQNSEQALRTVPDDPAGLLRARIRAYYGGSGMAVQDENN